MRGLKLHAFGLRRIRNWLSGTWNQGLDQHGLRLDKDRKSVVSVTGLYFANQVEVTTNSENVSKNSANLAAKEV